MKTCYLHIGFGKTGTTSTQDFLLENKKNLQQAGYHYLNFSGQPDSYTGGSSSGNGSLVARSLLAKGHFFHLKDDDILNYFERLLKDTLGNVIVSSEFFSMHGVAGLSRVIDIIVRSGFEYKIICYIRRQDSMSISAYSQAIKANHASVEKDFADEIISLSFNFDYYRYLKPLINTFGLDNFIIRCFERGQINSDVRKDFIKQIGLNEDCIAKLSFGKSTNKSDPILVTYMKYLMLRSGISPDVASAFWEQAFEARWGRIPVAFDDYIKRMRLQLIHRYEYSNRLVATEFLQRADGVLFYDPLPLLSQNMRVDGTTLF